eukprot:m.3840 g.3840  ORF g.3840 m.3840 type:complete len:553 (+) comp9861_c0_seq1:31-1689(+)
MAIPSVVLTGIWLPFVIVGGLSLFLCAVYIRYYQRKRDAELAVTITIVSGLTVSLLTLALVPVDIFGVTEMKNSSGDFQQWALSNLTRDDVGSTFRYMYYGFYSVVMLYVFLVLPFMYFYYEEGDEGVSTGRRCCSALKYWIGFCVAFGIILLIGAFVPWASVQDLDGKNQSAVDEAKLFLGSFASDKGQNALSFTISFLALIGAICSVVYTGPGMATLPVDLIRGYKNVEDEREEMKSSRKRHDSHRRDFDKGGIRRATSSKDRKRLENFKAGERLLKRRQKRFDAASKGCGMWCHKCLRPFKIVLGIVLLLVSLLIFFCLLMNGIDRLLHSAGYHYGFLLKKSSLPNPVGYLLLITQAFFPLDYVLMVALIAFFVLATLYGIRRMGIWFFCLKMYRVRPHRTPPQGLMFTTLILMTVVVSLGVTVTTLAPEYTRYGHQKFSGGEKENTNSTNCTIPSEPQTCTLEKQALLCDSSQCAQTQISGLVYQFCYRIWFFSLVYFICQWGMLVTFLLALVIVLCKRKRSNIHDYLDSDTESSSDESVAGRVESKV